MRNIFVNNVIEQSQINSYNYDKMYINEYISMLMKVVLLVILVIKEEENWNQTF